MCVSERVCGCVCVSETVWGYFIKKKGILVWCKKQKEWVGWAHVNSKSNTYSLDTDPDGLCCHWTPSGKRRARHSTSSVCVKERERVCVCVRESVWVLERERECVCVSEREGESGLVLVLCWSWSWSRFCLLV